MDKTEYSIRYISDKNLDFISEFVERSFSFPYVITGEKVTFTFENTSDGNLSKFTDLFLKNNVPHFTSGPDGESIIYYSQKAK